MVNVRSANGNNKQQLVKKRNLMFIGSIKKERIFEELKKNNMKDIAEKVSHEDQMSIDDAMKKIRKDARGRFMYNKQDALALLPFFNKYIDSKVGKNIFGCGGCVTNVLNKMVELKSHWSHV